MEESQFDKTLRDFVASSELPYDAAQWSRLAGRLDEEEDKKGVVLPLVPRAGRSSTRYWLLMPAAAACLVLVFLWLGKKGSVPVLNHQMPASTAVTTPATQSTARLDSKPVLSPEKATAASHPIIGREENRSNYIPEVHIAASSIDTSAVAVAAILPKDKPIVDTSTRKKVAGAGKPEQPRIDSRIPGQDDMDDFGRDRRNRKLAFGVLGGYNMGDAKGAFTLGVSMQKPLGGRLQLETGLAVVSGAYETYREVNQQPGPGILGKEYEETSNRLLYLQAAPTLGYKITKTLSAGAGVDAQRLLSSAASAMLLDAKGRETVPQPLWDFGLTAKLDYQLLSRLKAGLTYRKSLQSTNGGSGAAARDYLQVQMGYLIFR
jgi:hypothetical protein